MLMSTAIKATRIKAVKSYSYLGAIIEENGKIEVYHNIGKGCKLYNPLKTTFLGKREISKKIRQGILDIHTIIGAEMRVLKKIK